MALVAGDTSTLNATNANGCFVVGTKGDVNIFGQVPTDLFGMPLTAPELKFYDLKNAIVDGEPDIARLLSWRYRLVEKPYGRQAEINAIVRWAEDDDPLVLLRMIEGPGGSGKTRLAAEAALALKARGWQAGFLPRSGSHAYTAGDKGLLLIIDYPEEQPERIRALIDAIRDRPEPPHRLRILLLSRRSYEDWSETFAPIREQIGKLLIARLEELPVEDARTLIGEASNRLRLLLGKQDSHTSAGIEKWLETKDNRLSLYATAAAVHLVLAPDETFGLGARNIMAGLVAREVGRVNEASRKAELGEHALARLLALAPVAGGLTPAAISRLAEPEMQIFDCDKYQVMDRLRSLPWWDGKDNILPALTPDILAAVLTSSILKKTPDLVPR